ncbi:MAG: TPR end-of-group domain-containing protein [Bacteroidia bacterium]
MRNNIQSCYPVLLIAGALISGCSVNTNMQKNNYTVAPNPLEMKGDSVLITMSATVPERSINPKANVQFVPYLKTSKGDIQLKPVTIGGEEVTDNVDFKVSSKTGGKVTYTDKVAYTPDMKRCTMYPSFAVKMGAEYKTLETPAAKGAPAAGPKALAEGTMVTSLMVKGTETVTGDNTPYTASTATKPVNIYYLIDNSKFNPNFKVAKLFDNKKQIEDLKGLLKTDKNWKVMGITINGFASPDGELSRNEGLSKAREESSFEYFKKELKKLGFAEANDSNMSRGYSLSEDWAGYIKAIEACNHPDKNAVLDMIKATSSDDEKEARIKKDFKKFWDATKNVLLPPLRRSEIIVKGQTPLKTDDELRALMGTPDQMSDAELLHLASVTADNTQKMSIYNAFNARFPNDWRGYNGLATVYLSTGDYNSAKSNLEKANANSPENGAVLANMGVVYRAKGDYANAEKSYKAAASKGADVSYNMGILCIKKGNYAEAVSNFKKTGKNDFNTALAELMNGSVENCKTILDNMKPESKDWACYYLKAIASARAGNADDMAANLTRALQANAEVRNMAKEDVEFIKFWSNTAFQGAIK